MDPETVQHAVRDAHHRVTDLLVIALVCIGLIALLFPVTFVGYHDWQSRRVAARERIADAARAARSRRSLASASKLEEGGLRRPASGGERPVGTRPG